jgi:predicted nucleotidyltransferase
MKKERYPYINNPYGFKLPEQNPIIHPVVKKWDDFTESDKLIFLEIKNKIISVIGDFKVSVFGSRIRGNWTDDSDYDVLINKELSIEELDKLREINHEVKVDASYCSYDTEVPFFSIEIP